MARKKLLDKTGTLGDCSHVSGFEFLLRLPIDSRRKVSTTPAVYFIHDSTGFIFYIGSTLNLHERMGSYKGVTRSLERAGSRPLWLAWMPANPSWVRTLESDLIEKIRPPLNGIHKNIYKGINRNVRTYSYRDAVFLARQKNPMVSTR